MFEGHLNIGKRLRIYGKDERHWGIEFYTKKFGYVCFRLPFRSCGSWHPFYFYCSPNATPWAATFMIGKKASPKNWKLSKLRKSIFGHNFYMAEYHYDIMATNYDILNFINNYLATANDTKTVLNSIYGLRSIKNEKEAILCWILSQSNIRNIME